MSATWGNLGIEVQHRRIRAILNTTRFEWYNIQTTFSHKLEGVLNGGCFIQSYLVLCPSQIPAARVSLTMTYLQPKCFFPPHVLHPWAKQGECRQLTAEDLLPTQCPSWVRTWDVNVWRAKENMRRISYVVSQWTIPFMVSASVSRLSPSMPQNTAVTL